MKHTLLLVIITAIISGCSNPGPEKGDTVNDDYSLAMAILYNHYSAEYKALTLQAYNIATERLNSIADTAKDIGRLAVIVDIDETVLDNSPYQARCIVENFSYPEGWDEWCNESIAEAIPGALEFLSHADSMGYKIFYVSNRKKEFVYDATLTNLVQKGFPQADEESVLLRVAMSENNPDPSDKEPRREFIQREGYNIVLMAGDNLGDFYKDNIDAGLRNQGVFSQRDDFGTSFIILPNAMYGNWPASIGLDGSTEKTLSRLREMTMR